MLLHRAAVKIINEVAVKAQMVNKCQQPNVSKSLCANDASSALLSNSCHVM